MKGESCQLAKLQKKLLFLSILFDFFVLYLVFCSKQRVEKGGESRVFRLLRDMVTLFTLSLSKESVACRIPTELMWLRFTSQLLPMRKKLDGCPITSDP